MSKKKFSERKFGKILNGIVSNKIVRGAAKITGIGSPIVETIRNWTTPPDQEKPHKSTKVQWISSLVALGILVYLGVIPIDVLIDCISK